ncbi:3-dehydroquinate synthase [Pyrococcus sp. NA2]|uniref:3-dehydroquinate synthase n=1 Tax=Pyrococcus sp. (strain NA2) TaxID=342949 RepID=UPI000209A8F0|nr:3-dehydroquinate synthase [Pyrococcus sp. NA2]AEC51238.1 3-dehydroquinate synthase [Pyrococcus sp. NA2]
MKAPIFAPLSELSSLVESLNPYKIAVLTDENVEKLWLPRVLEILDGYEVLKLVIPEGEEQKSIDTAITIWDRLFDFGFTRKSLLIGLGGGVITDLAGFVASTYMRGTLLGFIPTTLMAQVDAAIGGKTGVNFHGKNIIGTFYLPNFILISLETLSTLPMVEILNGLAEIVKYAILDANVYEILRAIRDPREVTKNLELIKASVDVKLRIVREDLRESGKRRVLNLGHTVGHAIEKLSDYKIKHGFAVSIGLAAAAKVGEFLYGFDSGKVIELLERFNLPRKLPFEPEKVISAMKMDKKAWYGRIVFIVPIEIGKVSIEEVPEEVILKSLEDLT